jgi:hypothetical protein
LRSERRESLAQGLYHDGPFAELLWFLASADSIFRNYRNLALGLWAQVRFGIRSQDFSEYRYCILHHLMITLIMVQGWDLSTRTWLGVASHSDSVCRTGRQQTGEGIRELSVENSTRC